MKKYDLVIIGAGSGGLTALRESLVLGLKVLLVEKNKIGGDCLWHGCIPSKTLIHEAGKLKIIEEEGMKIDYEKHFKITKNRIKMVQEKISAKDSLENLIESGAEVLFGEAKFLDKNKLLINGAKKIKIKFNKCIIATGSRPMVPKIFEKVKYYTSNNIFQLENLPKSMTIVGGGSVGVEIATAFAMFGVKINIVLKEDRIMPKEETEVSVFMKKKMESIGINFYDNADIKDVIHSNGNINIIIDKNLNIESELLFIATGRQFNTDLNFKKAGIKLGDRKEIIVNNYLQSSNPKVYAIGDVNGLRLFTHAAGYQAKAAIKNMQTVFRWRKQKSIPTAFPWVTYTYPEVAHVGEYSKNLTEENIFFNSYVTKLESVDRVLTNQINEEGFIEVLVGSRGKILGVTIVSPHAGELITEWTLAMSNNLPVETIFNSIHAYPTLSELNPRGAFEYVNEKTTRKKSFLTVFYLELIKFLFKRDLDYFAPAAIYFRSTITT